MTPAHAMLRLVRPDDDDKHRETTRHTRTLFQRRRKIVIPLTMIWLVMAALAGVLLLTGTQPSTPFGDTATVPNGLARISAVIPLESDGWVPPSAADRLTDPVPDGAHRVRLLLELTAADAAGLTFDAAEYSLSGIGVSATALWFEPAQQSAANGASILATLVFEVPNQASTLVLDGPQEARLSLGTAHHTAP